MPPINRDKNTEYVILSITDGKNKMLDLTTANNKRNYKHKLINELKAQADKRSPVYQEFKNSNINTIEVEVLDAINGTYLHALNYMNKIATKYNYKTPKVINSTILDIQLELQAKQLEQAETTLSQTTSPTPTEKEEPTQAEPVKEEPALLEPAQVETSEVVKKPKKAVQKIKLKPLTEEDTPTTSGIVANTPTTELIKEAINTPIKAPPTITIDYEKDEELEPLEFKVILPTKQKLTKKQEQQKNKLIENNKQTITEYDTLKKQKESLEAKMNTLHLEILNNYTTLANTFQYVDGSISEFNFE